MRYSQEKNDLIAKLNSLLELTSCDYLTPTILSKHHKSLYGKLKVCFADENGETDWFVIAQKIDPNLRSKFRFNRTKSSALKELLLLLQERKPSKISSRSIKKMAPNLFDFLRLNFRDRKGYIDWPSIISNFDEEIRVRFVFPVLYKKNLPEEVYENECEVKERLSVNMQFAYTFLHANRGEEFEKRNEICLSLIELAKKGNKSAENKLIEFMRFLSDEWAEKIPTFGAFKYYPDESEEIIRRCIYNYRNAGPFVGYVNASLAGAALELNCIREVSFSRGRL